MVMFVKRIVANVFLYSVGMIYGCMVLCRLLWSILREGTDILKSTATEQGMTFIVIFNYFIVHFMYIRIQYLANQI